VDRRQRIKPTINPASNISDLTGLFELVIVPEQVRMRERVCARFALRQFDHHPSTRRAHSPSCRLPATLRASDTGCLLIFFTRCPANNGSAGTKLFCRFRPFRRKCCVDNSRSRPAERARCARTFPNDTNDSSRAAQPSRDGSVPRNRNYRICVPIDRLGRV
jgi:hypothetical protein